MKIAIIGADGQLGTDLVLQNTDAVGLTIKELDITSQDACRKVLGMIKPDVVINTAAFHQVDDCEDKIELAFSVNVFGPRNLAVVCKELGAELVSFSTDYVFSGDKGKPYQEEDCPNPQSVYAISKLAGELVVKSFLPEHYIVRTCGIFGTAGCMGKGGTNFVEGILKAAKNGQPLKVVNDEIVSPTYSVDLASKIMEIVRRKEYGLFHITNSGQCSWFQFAKKILELSKIKLDILPISAAQYQAKAHRPKYSVMAHGHLKKLGLDNMRSWEAALEAYLLQRCAK